MYCCLAILFLLLLGTYLTQTTLRENWQSYKQTPFGEVKTGQDPLYFYAYYRYRKPYRWPFRFHSTYPYPHLEPYP